MTNLKTRLLSTLLHALEVVISLALVYLVVRLFNVDVSAFETTVLGLVLNFASKFVRTGGTDYVNNV